MLTIDEIPDAVRRAMAYRAALEALGYNADDQIWIVPTTGILAAQLPAWATIRPPVVDAPPGATWLLVTLSLSSRFDETDAVIVTGAIDGAELARCYPEAATAAYNALTLAQRGAERRRWISLDRLIWLASQLMARDIFPDLNAALAAHRTGGN